MEKPRNPSRDKNSREIAVDTGGVVYPAVSSETVEDSDPIQEIRPDTFFYRAIDAMVSNAAAAAGISESISPETE